MITIKQFIESIVLDFEPRWVAKDQDGEVSVYGTRPSIEADEKFWSSGSDQWQNFGIIKLTEFENCPWEECLCELPRRTTWNEFEQKKLAELERKLNAIVDAAIEAVNELKGANNE